MGTVLSHDLGHRYAAVGLTAFEVYLNWPGIFCGGPLPLDDDAVDTTLHGLGQGDLLIDLNFRGNPAHPPLFTPGTYYTLQNGAHVVPGRTFDLLVYLERSPAMTPLRFAVCQ